MSLVLTLALRNLLQDRLRFIASLMGIVFSVVLVMVQIGLYFGFSGMISTMIDHTSTDLWIVSSGTKYFEDLSVLSTATRNRLLAVEGVSEVVPGVVGFSAWGLPGGAMTSVIIVGTDIAHGGLSPWNVVEGTAQSLTTPGTVVVDRSYSDQLGVSGVGVTAQIRGQPVTAAAPYRLRFPILSPVLHPDGRRKCSAGPRLARRARAQSDGENQGDIGQRGLNIQNVVFPGPAQRRRATTGRDRASCRCGAFSYSRRRANCRAGLSKWACNNGDSLGDCQRARPRRSGGDS